jgi:hypothetical protein
MIADTKYEMMEPHPRTVPEILTIRLARETSSKIIILPLSKQRYMLGHIGTQADIGC